MSEPNERELGLWRERVRLLEFDLRLAASDNLRLREALECCADMLCRIDAGTATESAIDFARNVASDALEASDE